MVSVSFVSISEAIVEHVNMVLVDIDDDGVMLTALMVGAVF